MITNNLSENLIFNRKTNVIGIVSFLDKQDNYIMNLW